MPVGAIVGAGVLGAGATVYGANTAASAQTAAANQSLALQQQMFNTSQTNLNPFIQNGTASSNLLTSMLGTGAPTASGMGSTGAVGTAGTWQGLTSAGGLTTPFQPTMGSLASTPGYQFSLNQGLQATQNAAAAQGLGSSGAAIKGAANYAEGLAGTTYQNQQANYTNTQQSIYNMLNGQATTGANAAAGLASNATATGTSMGNTAVGAGNATAAATMAGTNAVSGALTNGASAYTSYNLLQSMLGAGSGVNNAVTPNYGQSYNINGGGYNGMPVYGY